MSKNDDLKNFKEREILRICSTDDYNDAIYYLEKALKYKPDDSETKKKLEILRMKVKTCIWRYRKEIFRL